MTLPFVTLDVFTTSPYTGNPLAIVFLDEKTTNLSTSQKQLISREFNLSETVFVHPITNDDNKRHMTIFTTDHEVPFAGHPTIGSASWFLNHSPNEEDRDVRVLSMKAGDVPIARDGKAVSAQVAHNVRIHGIRFPLEKLLRLHPSLTSFFGDTGIALPGFPVVSIVNGMSQVHIELPSLVALDAVTTAAGGETVSVTKYLDEGWQNGLVIVYFFVRDVLDPESRKKTIRTRAILGNLEDPATGSAASGLAAYLALSEGESGRYRYDIVQGVEMGRRSQIGVEVCVNEKEIEGVELRGDAVKVSEGNILVPGSGSGSGSSV